MRESLAPPGTRLAEWTGDQGARVREGERDEAGKMSASGSALCVLVRRLDFILKTQGSCSGIFEWSGAGGGWDRQSSLGHTELGAIQVEVRQHFLPSHKV